MAILSDYVAGTITLTNGSAAFTGTGTAWQTAQFREGDTILDIAGGDFRTAVIASITGEGSGTLTRAWTGPSVVNAGYRMRYMSDGSRSSAQARALINLLGGGSIQALAGLTGAADKLPYFTGANAAALTTLTAFARTMLDDASLADMQNTLKLTDYMRIGTSQGGYLEDADALTKEGNYIVDADWVGSPFPGTVGANQGYLQHYNWGNSTYKLQVFTQINGGNHRFFRRKDQTSIEWQPWVEISTKSDLVQHTLPGHLYRLTLSNNVTDANNDIDIAAGAASDDGGAVSMVLAAGITKRLDAAWAVGTGVGGLDSGVKASDTTYHVWLIRRPDTGVVDALFSTSSTNPTMPANYTQKRRIGSILTDDSGNIRAFRQVGGWFHWYSPALDLSLSGTVGTSATNNALRVPTGIKVLADFGVTANAPSANASLGICDPDLGSAEIDDHALILPQAPDYSGSVLQCWTNTSGEISIRSSAASSTAFIRTRGWYDLRDMSF